MGKHLNELMRHHPVLKETIHASVAASLEKLEELGNTYVPPAEMRHWYYLVGAPATTIEGDVEMADVEGDANHLQKPEQGTSREDGADSKQDEPVLKGHDNLMVNFISIIGRVCLSSTSHAARKDFFCTVSRGPFFSWKRHS